MHPTRNDLTDATRRKVAELLSTRLATAIDLALQAKQAHWNVKGPNFIALHELFDSIAATAHGHADELAERIAALGGTADGTVQAIVRHSALAPYAASLATGNGHLEALADAVAAAARLIRAGIDAADEAGDAVTADLCTEIAGTLDQKLWLVEAHLQSAA